MAHLTNLGSASLRSLPGKQALLQNRNFLFKCARRSKIVKLEGNTVTLAAEGGQTQVVKLNSVEGLTVGTTVEIEGYSPETMTGERAQVIQP